MKKILFMFLLITASSFGKEALKFESYINDKKEIVIRVVKDNNPSISNSIEMADGSEQTKEVASNTQPSPKTTTENKI